MKSDFWLDQIPLWGVFLLTIVIVLLSVRMGALLGNRRRRQPEHETDASLGTIIGATLGLLAFMLAFTFGFAAERLQARKQLLLDEVNTIGTTYLRAGLLLEPHQSEIRRLLREYVDIRANLAREDLSRQPQKLDEALSRSETLHDQMWSHAVALADADRSSEIDALFISSLNEMIDLHNSRLTVARYRIPTTLWNVLYFITILSMATVGYQAGLSAKSSLRIGLVLAFTFSIVVFLIADLDRVTEGHLRVNQQPLLELQKKMQTPEAEAGHEQIFSESQRSSAGGHCVTASVRKMTATRGEIEFRIDSFSLWMRWIAIWAKRVEAADNGMLHSSRARTMAKWTRSEQNGRVPTARPCWSARSGRSIRPPGPQNS